MKFIPQELSAVTTENVQFLEDRLSSAPISNRTHINSVLSGVKRPQEVAVGMNYLHELQRLNWVVSADVVNSDTLNALETNRQTWKHFQEMPMTCKQFKDLGKKLYGCQHDMTSSVALIVNDYSKRYAEQVLQNCLVNNNQTLIHFNDDWTKNMILSSCASEEQVHKFATAFRQPWQESGRRITLKSDFSSFEKDNFVVDETLRKNFVLASKEIEKANKYKPYSLTGMLTPEHAQLDGVRLSMLVQHYYRMCMMDTSILNTAHVAIQEMIDNGKNIIIRNSHGADLYASIDGMEAFISLTERNLPGTEVQTAPKRDSVNGIFKSHERYVHDGQVMAGIFIEFKDGRAIKWHANKGYDVLSRLLETDEGSRYVGEIGLGTNIYSPPHQSSLNIVGEKKMGVHLGMGSCFQNRVVDGKTIQLDNGNISVVHKDYTLAMLGDAKGEIIIDGRHLMQNGIYVRKGTEILNTRPFVIS